MAGRPRGAKDREPRHTAASKQARDVAKTGVTPLHVMLTAMRFWWAAALEEEDELKRLELMRVAHGLACAAAPYCHPKLASVQHTGSSSSPIPYVIYGEREAGTADEWVKDHGPIKAVVRIGWSEGVGDVL